MKGKWWGADDDECEVYDYTYLGWYTPQGCQFGYPTTRYSNSGGDCYWVGGRYHIYLWLDHCFSQSTSQFLEANVEPQKYICRVVQVVGHLSHEDHEDRGWNSCIAWNDWRLTDCSELLMGETMHHFNTYETLQIYNGIFTISAGPLVQDFCHLWALRDSQSVFWSRFSRVYTQEI